MDGFGGISRQNVRLRAQAPQYDFAGVAPSAVLPYAAPGPYLTILPPQQEGSFQQWVNANEVPFDPSPEADYDMRGFWLGLQNHDPHASQGVSDYDGHMHFSDYWKTPYHRTFSSESRFARPGAPRWFGDVLTDGQGRVVADETPGGGY